jgi:hypothetical protein
MNNLLFDAVHCCLPVLSACFSSNLASLIIYVGLRAFENTWNAALKNDYDYFLYIQFFPTIYQLTFIVIS